MNCFLRTAVLVGLYVKVTKMGPGPQYILEYKEASINRIILGIRKAKLGLSESVKMERQSCCVTQ